MQTNRLLSVMNDRFLKKKPYERRTLTVEHDQNTSVMKETYFGSGGLAFDEIVSHRSYEAQDELQEAFDAFASKTDRITRYRVPPDFVAVSFSIEQWGFAFVLKNRPLLKIPDRFNRCETKQEEYQLYPTECFTVG